MSTVTLKGNPFNTVGVLPSVGESAADFRLVKTDLSETTLADYKGSRLVLNIFPSVDTPTCAMSVRKFNEQVSQLENTKVLCVSADLPFAAARFCGAEGIDNVATGSSFRGTFGTDYGVEFVDGPLKGLLSRSVVVLDESGKVIYTEQVSETADEPDYDAAVAAL
ncbi:thiol peroxidase [Paraglaciecola chathamensis]|jgi:thiol peroxidase|uniref:Thiol peroxidase n=3 Tax=Paraglaciecola chathamensis TaxID=368405 RepID=A0ABS0WFP3_9ALTE|nr:MULTISPECIES: thiol peroxidase [Paraglaciecola]MBN26063.1 lipid hydroperoxide peroxidase [Alteromonadaceae bacterium]MBJ2137265.1 thiol peroxidase [Paraglaciecola chathamensis]MBU3018269.1 thiol peroxidase [Paraglaciecola agarilytica]MDO6561089.1 thiol peroxidase [Paraglaciecola chathamensis]MDO6839092.1 thiol peroxidase [Paraglaciecola chathamensis]|tara:strand:+ start:20961 stop:21455 length:495 start_codon:yes stop_codon:yes gene_type:complete